MKIEMPEVPENHIEFAKAVKKAADEFGIEKLSVTYRPAFENRLELDRRFNGDMKIHYSSVDGRCRPASNLSIELDTRLTQTIIHTPESCS